MKRSIVAVLLLMACDGTISEPLRDRDRDDPRVFEPEDVRLEARIWRLTPHHFESETRRLFGEGVPEVDLPDSAGENHLTNIAANGRIDLGNAAAFAEAARTVATWVTDQGASVARCDAFGTTECVDQLLAWLPSEAFRRPVSSDEQSELRQLFDDLSAEYEFEYAFTGLIRAVLLHPSFLYRTELGADDDDGVKELTGAEIATLLAFAVTDQGPDDALLARADQLDDPGVREEEARRLIRQSGPMWQRFFWEWLHMATLQSQGTEVGLSDALVEQIREEYEAFVEGVIVDESGSLRDLLTTTHTWTRPALAAHYGASHPGGGLQRIELDPAQRGGLLTQAAWLVSHGKRGRANVVRRGMGIFLDAMCHDITPPDDLDLDAELERIAGPDATVAEIVAARGGDGTCGGCHRVADPVGLVFESFASDGSWQTVYEHDGLPVETTITLDGLGAFDRAPDMSRALADHEGFQYCFVQRFAHFMVGRDLGEPAAVGWSSDAHRDFVENDLSFEELVVAMVRHPAFVERRK